MSVFETKTSLSEETISVLQDLIQVNLDSRDGFTEAAATTQELAIASMFRQLADERDAQAEELRALVAANCEQPSSHGSLAAAAHRLLIDMRAALGGGVAAMLSEAERGEDHIRHRYEQAMEQLLGGAVDEILSRHYAAVAVSHDHVRDLRDHYREP